MDMFMFPYETKGDEGTEELCSSNSVFVLSDNMTSCQYCKIYFP